MIKNEQKRKREPVVMSMVNDQCVWGRAGVIKPIKCINAFDCLGCSMDQRVLANFEEKRSAAGQKGSKATQNGASHEPGQMPAYVKRPHFIWTLFLRI